MYAQTLKALLQKMKKKLYGHQLYLVSYLQQWKNRCLTVRVLVQKLATIKLVECSETCPSDKYKGHARTW